MAMGEVVQLFAEPDTSKRRCYDCYFGLDTERGTYCELFGEWLLTDLAARDCDAYDPKEQ